MQLTKSTKSAERVPDVILNEIIIATWACEEGIKDRRKTKRNYYKEQKERERLRREATDQNRYAQSSSWLQPRLLWRILGTRGDILDLGPACFDPVGAVSGSGCQTGGQIAPASQSHILPGSEECA